MALVTLQVLEGLERGTTFADLETPVTIGREEDNTVRLNDERVSRFHAKLQEDGGRVILTDLDSTNGTRVNGRPVAVRVLRPGDQIALGRCLLTYGSREQIDRQLAAEAAAAGADRSDADGGDGDDAEATRGAPPVPPGAAGEPRFLPVWERPALPSDLDAPQRAELCDLLGFLHEELRQVILAGEERTAPGTNHDAETSDDADGSAAPASAPAAGDLLPPRVVTAAVWQRLARLEMELAELLREAPEPT